MESGSIAGRLPTSVLLSVGLSLVGNSPDMFSTEKRRCVFLFFTATDHPQVRSWGKIIILRADRNFRGLVTHFSFTPWNVYHF